MGSKSGHAGKEVRLFNVLFPIWLLFLLPSVWLYVLPGNFIIDSAVVLITLSILAKKRGDADYSPWRDWLRVIWRVWIIGFVSDLIGAGFMLFWGYIPGVINEDGAFSAWWTNHITDPISTNPFSSFFALVFALLAVALSGLMIYVLNKRFSFNKVALEQNEKNTIALWMAVCTAPWLMLMPSEWMW